MIRTILVSITIVFDEELARIGALVGAGRAKQVEPDARAAVERAQALGHAPLEARARFRLGLLEDELGRYEASVEQLEQAYFIAQRERLDGLQAEAAPVIGHRAFVCGAGAEPCSSPTTDDIGDSAHGCAPAPPREDGRDARHDTAIVVAITVLCARRCRRVGTAGRGSSRSPRTESSSMPSTPPARQALSDGVS